MEKVKSLIRKKLPGIQSSRLLLQKILFKNLADNTPVMIWISNSDKKFTFFNSSWLDFRGKKLEDEKSFGWMRGIHKEDQQRFNENYNNAFNAHRLFVEEFRLRRYDGNYHWLMMVGKPNKVDGVFKGYVGTGIDIQEQKDATKVMQDNFDQIQLILDSLTTLAWSNNIKGKVTYSNTHWFILTGQTTEDLIKYGPRDYVHPEDYIKVDQLWMEHSASGLPMETEIRYLRASDKTYRWHLVRAVPVKNESGIIASWISTGTDIHSQKLFAVELEKQVEERTKALQDANLNLQYSINDLQQFAFVASHDLQEPLRKIILYTNRLKEEYNSVFPEKALDHMERIVNASKLVKQLISDLLNFTHVSVNDFQFAPTDINELLKEVLTDFVSTISLKNAKITIEPMPVIDAVPGQIKQLFHHLISNALKFSIDEVSPEVSLSGRLLKHEELNQYQSLNPELEYLEIRIQDNGIGFDQQMAEKIFIIFQRLHGKGDFLGTGIGLALSGKIVQNHNGIIYAKSQKNNGAVFYLILPLRQGNNNQVS